MSFVLNLIHKLFTGSGWSPERLSRKIASCLVKLSQKNLQSCFFFINLPKSDIQCLLEFLNVEPSPLFLSKVVHQGLSQVYRVSYFHGAFLHCVAHSTHVQTLAEEVQDMRRRLPANASVKRFSCSLECQNHGTMGTETHRILELNGIRGSLNPNLHID